MPFRVGDPLFHSQTTLSFLKSFPWLCQAFCQDSYRALRDSADFNEQCVESKDHQKNRYSGKGLGTEGSILSAFLNPLS